MFTIFVLAVLVLGVALWAFARLAPRRAEPAHGQRAAMTPAPSAAWASEAGEEFAGLSESQRCDLVFAVAKLDDERSRHLLEHALCDPAEPVCLAAAHALAASGRRASVEAFLADRPGPRADRIAQILALLD